MATSSSVLSATSMTSWFSPAKPAEGEGGLIEHEKANNKMLRALRENEWCRTLLMRAAAGGAFGERGRATGGEADVIILLPQSVTLEDVDVTPELVETHLVLLQRGALRSAAPRGFRSCNGVCGTCRPDDADGNLESATLLVHGRDVAGADAGLNFAGRPSIPQLESSIQVLRESRLPPSDALPLERALPLLLISDPIFYPGCGWKLDLALSRVTHRFSEIELGALTIGAVPQLLFEYQVLARAWQRMCEEAAADDADDADADDADDDAVEWVGDDGAFEPASPVPVRSGAGTPSRVLAAQTPPPPGDPSPEPPPSSMETPARPYGRESDQGAHGVDWMESPMG
jgi:hypothetical protein